MSSVLGHYRLMNLGNTCYMNVVIQILYSLPSFVLAMERLSDFVKQEAELSKVGVYSFLSVHRSS